MGIIGITGSRKAVNHYLMCYAITHTPSIIVDCSNIANIHKWFPLFPHADFDQVFVYEFELLYKFRDCLVMVQEVAAARGVTCIIITSMHHLFNYQNEAENYEIYNHAWELMLQLSAVYDVRVAVDSKLHLHFSARYSVPLQPALAENKTEKRTTEGTMGHTAWSQRQNLEHMISELNGYSKSLRKEERLLMQDMLSVPMRHVGSVASANSLHAWSFLLCTIMLEQEKRLRLLESHASMAYRRVPHEAQHRLVAQN